jgi:hypothetical protein
MSDEERKEERKVAPTVGGGTKAPTGAGVARGGIAESIAPTVASR